MATLGLLAWVIGRLVLGRIGCDGLGQPGAPGADGDRRRETCCGARVDAGARPVAGLQPAHAGVRERRRRGRSTGGSERDVHDAYGLAARLLASFVALALLFGAFHVLAPSAESSARPVRPRSTSDDDIPLHQPTLLVAPAAGSPTRRATKAGPAWRRRECLRGADLRRSTAAHLHCATAYESWCLAAAPGRCLTGVPTWRRSLSLRHASPPDRPHDHRVRDHSTSHRTPHRHRRSPPAPMVREPVPRSIDTTATPHLATPAPAPPLSGPAAC